MLGRFEPVLNAYTISTIASAVIACLVAFNVPITEDQRNALLGLVAAICAIFFGGAVLARNNTYSVASVDRIRNEAKTEGAQSAIQQLYVEGKLSANAMNAVAPNPRGGL